MLLEWKYVLLWNGKEGFSCEFVFLSFILFKLSFILDDAFVLPKGFIADNEDDGFKLIVFDLRFDNL